MVDKYVDGCCLQKSYIKVIIKKWALIVIEAPPQTPSLSKEKVLRFFCFVFFLELRVLRRKQSRERTNSKETPPLIVQNFSLRKKEMKEDKQKPTNNPP